MNQSPAAHDDDEVPGSYRELWTWALAIVGLGLTFLSFLAEDWVGLWGVDWPWIEASEAAVVQSVLTNFGTGFISAAVLLRLEPAFKRAVQRTANTAVAVATKGIASRVQSLEDEVDRIASDADAAIRVQDEAVEAASAAFSYQTVFDLMNEVLDSGAIVDGQITVQGTDSFGEFVVTLACHEGPVNRIELQPEDLGRRLRIMVNTKTGRAVETWHTDEPFSEAVDRLHKELNRVKAWGLSQPRPWRQAMDRLNAALDVALCSQRKELEAIHLKGTLVEIIADGWYITDEGLECPENHGYYLPRSNFPFLGRPTFQGNLGGGNVLLGEKQQERPSWANEEVWTYALERCRVRFARRQTITGDLVEDAMVPHEELGRALP